MMITQAPFSTAVKPGPGPQDWLRRAWSFNPALVIFTLASALLLVAGVVGMLIDPRIVLGMPNWAKSTKFGISLLIYGLTLLWFLPMLTRRPRLARLVATGTGVLLTFEILLLAIQATRGVPMHFNESTPLDTALWRFMSGTIMIFWLITLLGVGLLLFQPLANRVLAWSVRLGMLITLIGLTQGFLMTSPNSTQLAMLEAGQRLDLVGAHTVGGLDGGPGLPLLGWSIDHGDLRIGHFVGIHGAQVIPLLGILLLQLSPGWLRQGHRLALVAIGAAGYLGLVALVTWQALRDQPLLQPDALTFGALGGLGAATALAAGLVVLLSYARRAVKGIS
jgi:hypothetical protein